MSDAFHFSPRPNRAGEIAWTSWSETAFARAKSEDKPILLAISAVWCHWCHVMDETTYSDPAVIAAINARFVPVRVDNDRRPDVNARYNMGGWPTTAFLTPDGITIAGATYLPPAQMQRTLDDIADLYATRKDEIAARAAATRMRTADYCAGAPEDLQPAAIATLVDALEAGYDTEYGGFGEAPKFPQPDVLEFLLTHWRATGQDAALAMVVGTMRAMTTGGMYDHEEGGFFRYSTTRDWSVPHFEKMAEDHAGLLRVLAQLVIHAPEGDGFRAALASAAGYVRDVLRDPQSGLFAGSQDADEAYFALPLAQRRERAAPYVDRTAYANWSAGLASAGCSVALALEAPAIYDRAAIALDRLHDTMRDADGLLFHFIEPGGTPQVRGLLTDQVAYLRALLDAHAYGGAPRFLERARTHADLILTHFAAADGGFVDRLARDDALGRLSNVDRPIGENGVLAEALLRLAALTDAPAYRQAAEGVLCLYAATFAAAGSFAATYVRALERYLAPATTLRAVGTPAETAALRAAALRLRDPFVEVATLDAAAAADAGLPATGGLGYPCRGTRCGAPVREPSRLAAALAALDGGA